MTSEPARLLPTVISRCQSLGVDNVDWQVGLDWLQAQGADAGRSQLAFELSGGMPLKALTMLESGFLERREKLSQGLAQIMSGASPVRLAADCVMPGVTLNTERLITLHCAPLESMQASRQSPPGPQAKVWTHPLPVPD